MDRQGHDWDWQGGTGASVQIGAVNRNNQRCCGHHGVAGTDHMQLAYKVECMQCGYVYGANGSDLHERLCPECQGGARGIPDWSVPRTKAGQAASFGRDIAIGIDQARAVELSDDHADVALLREKVEEGLRQADAGRLIDHDAVRKYLLD